MAGLTDDTDRLVGLIALFSLGFFLATQETRMDGSIWRNVRCQRCGAVPIDKGKATANCPVCKSSELGERAPDYMKLTDSDRRWLRSLMIGAA
jgi:RNA polymerase subunit RPABC4/transcription elongation factor Spt4